MDEFLTADDLAKRLSVHKNTLYAWVTRREIPFVKLPGNTTRFPLAAVETWLERRFSKGKLLAKGIYLGVGTDGATLFATVESSGCL